MASLNNPAGRLHAFLAAYDEAVRGNGGSRRQAWSEVLRVTEAAVPMYLWEVSALVSSVNAAVPANDQGVAFRALWDHHLDHFTEPFTSELDYTAQPVDVAALVALDAVSAFLSASANEGTVPDDEQREALRDELLAAIEETKASDEVPSEIRQLIVERLHQIIWALDHVHIGGPGAVTAAVERLAGALGMRGPEVFETAPAKRSWSVARKVWNAFARGPEVQQALGAWSGVITDILSLGP